MVMSLDDNSGSVEESDHTLNRYNTSVVDPNQNILSELHSDTSLDPEARNVFNFPLQQNNAPRSYGQIAITNSSSVQIGDTTVYDGPVTIQVYRQESIIGSSSDTNNTTQSNGIPPKLTWNNLNRKSNNEVSEQDVQPIDVVALKWKAWRQAVLSATIIILFLIAVGVTIVIVRTLLSKSEGDGHYEGDWNETGTNLRFVDRIEWLATPSNFTVPLDTQPIPYVVITHTSGESCVKTPECKEIVREIQYKHITKYGSPDIGYNFLVGGDGYIYVGRGWNVTGNLSSRKFNGMSIGICMIGTFINELPPPRQMNALKRLVSLGIKLGYISPDYVLLGHKQVSATESPGRALYNELTKWPHWSQYL